MRFESFDFYKGKIMVFVEYNFDMVYKYIFDLIEFKRIVMWIVYVVIKVSDFKILIFFFFRFRIYIWKYYVMLGLVCFSSFRWYYLIICIGIL